MKVRLQLLQLSSRIIATLGADVRSRDNVADATYSPGSEGHDVDRHKLALQLLKSAVVRADGLGESYLM